MINRIRNLYYDIKNSILNLIRWIPVIWKIRDWDANHLYLLIYTHLNHMEDCLRNYGNAIDSEKIADEIKVAKNLSKRLWEEDYVSNSLIPVEEKYGESKIRFKSIENSQFRTVFWDETEKESKARDKAYKHSDYMEKQDKEMLFNLLKKKLEYWWD